MEIRAVKRATELLRRIATRPDGIALTELAAAASLSKTTTYRILQTLVATQFVSCDPLTGLYFPGHVFLQIGLATESFQGLKRAALPYLERLRDATGETAALVVMRGAERLTIDVVVGLPELKAVPEIGSAKPIYAGAAGKVLLASLSEDEVKRLIKQRPFVKVARNTIESPKALSNALKAVREQGYALSTEETVNGQGAIAAPIFCNGSLVGAVNLCVPTVRLSQDFVKEAIPEVVKAARKISLGLGGQAIAEIAPQAGSPRRTKWKKPRASGTPGTIRPARMG